MIIIVSKLKEIPLFIIHNGKTKNIIDFFYYFINYLLINKFLFILNNKNI